MARLYSPKLTLLRVAISLYTLFLAYASLAPGTGVPGSGVPGILLHLAAYLVLGLLASAAFPIRFERSRLRVVATVVGIGVLFELLQLVVPGRVFALPDLVANIAGAALVWFRPAVDGLFSSEGTEEEP
ncbi:MAG: VanZ family protein [Candidatus Nanohaloarchaea archaeon]|nr:VanZ family protein [Candidatus Nanohaloarchaea archaeon]